MTEETTVTETVSEDINPKDITDTQVEEFFKNEGKFEEKPKKATKKVEEPEVVEETVDEEPKEDKPKDEKKVNYGALHEERQRRKAEAARATKLEAELTELKAKYTQQPQQQQYQPQNPLEVIALRQKQIDDYLTEQETQRQSTAKENEFKQRYSDSANAFKQDAPDFTEAYNFLVDSRMQELQAIGYTPEQAQQVLIDDEKGIVNLAYQNEVNPAERIYNLAKLRGYTGKQPDPEPQPDNTQIEAKLDTIIKGQMTNKNLPPASKSVKSDLTPESLAAMNIDVLGSSDFENAWTKCFG